MIRCLPEDVRSGLRSGVAVGSLGQCVEELALNSIDADATCVAVRVNTETFKVQVADNGSGMGRRDLDRMGKRYFTSKCQSLRDLEHPKFHGFRGEAVASIVNLASAVEVSSKARGAGETLVKLFQGGRGLAAWAAASPRPSAGTTVTVHNLFHRLPVRRKRLDPRLELEQARQRLEALALAHPATSFSLRNDASGCVLLQLRKASDTRSRFCQVHGLAKARKLREVRFQHQEFELSGYISSEAHYNKRLQFLFVNKRLVLRTRLHRLIDFLLRRESVICRPSQPVDSSPPRQRSNPELHGIYVINIRCPAGEYDVCLDPTKTLIEFKNWDVVLVCVQEGIRTFLKQEQLLMELPSDDFKELNEDNGLTLLDVVLPPVASEEKSVQSSFQEACGTMRDSYEIFNTKSKTVKRKAAAENTTGKTWRSGGQTKDGQANSCADDMCFHDTVEASVCCQDDASSEPGLLTQQAAKFTESGKNDTENTCLEFECSEGSKVLKNSSQASLRCEDSREDPCLLKEKIHDGGVCEEPQQRPPPFGKIALETHDTRKEDERTRRVSNCDGEKTQFGTGQVQLCSTGFITHVMQTQPSKASETDFPTKHVQPGPVSARQIFGNRNQGSAETPNVDLSIHLSEVSTQFSNQNIVLTRMKEEPKTKSTGISKNKTIFHKKSSKRPHPSSLLSNASLAFPWNVHIAHNGKKTEELMAHRKPHLLSQPVSFEKFRRQIRKVKSSLPIRIQDLSDDFEKTTRDDFQKENGDLDHSNSCQIPTIINNEPSHSDPSISHVSSGQFPASEEEEKWEQQNACGRESPRAPTTDCAQRHRKSLNVNRPLGSLASKLSRMKGHSKEAFITQSIGRSNTCCVLPQDSHPLPQNMHTITGDSSPISDSNPAVQDNTCNKNINSHFSNQLSVINTTEELPMRHNSPLSPRNASFEVLKDPGVLSLSSGQQPETASPPSTALVRQVDISADDPISGEKEKTKISISMDDEPRAPSCDWQQHFDVSLGRTVYINKITGLSTFNAPQEDSLAACTKDLTTLAVNVVFGNDTVDETAGPDSLQTLFSEWENPVFARYPEVALDVSSEQAESLKVKIHNILYPYRFTKEMVHSMQVLQQVDNKFIACLMSTKWEANGKAGGNLLVLVDQHAAHERIRLEQLICDSYEKEQPESFRRKKLLSSTISPPMEVMVTEQQRRLLQCYHKALEDLGLKLLFPDDPSSHVLVREVPLCFVEREANEVRRGRPTVTKSILEELIREQVELLQTTGGAQGTLPLTIQKVLASQACHGAIKFNDSLSLEESCRLIEALSRCQLPFQCAHGRPSMLPLADIDHLEQEKQHPKPNLAKLCKMARAWHLFKKAETHDEKQNKG